MNGGGSFTVDRMEEGGKRRVQGDRTECGHPCPRITYARSAKKEGIQETEGKLPA